MSSDPAMPSAGASTKLSSLLHALVIAADWHECCAELARFQPEIFPATRLDIYVPGADQALARVFSTHAPWPEERAIEGGERALRAWYSRLSYFWMLKPLMAAGQVCGWMVLARRHVQLDMGVQMLAEQLAPMLALRLRDEQSQQILAMNRQHTARLEQRLRTNDTLMMHATLAAGTAHDLSNLFTSLLMHSQMLLQDVPAELQSDVSVILRAAEDGRHLLHRLQHGVAPPETGLSVVADPATTIQDVIELTRPLWEARNTIRVKTEIAETALARIRPADLREVLVNLLINAITALSSGGEITFGAQLAEGQVVITVADTGVGMSPELQQTIFQPFASTKAQGRGLGLSISRALLELYGGAISVRSEEGQGSVFSIILPATQRDRAASLA